MMFNNYDEKQKKLYEFVKVLGELFDDLKS